MYVGVVVQADVVVRLDVVQLDRTVLMEIRPTLPMLRCRCIMCVRDILHAKEEILYVHVCIAGPGCGAVILYVSVSMFAWLGSDVDVNSWSEPSPDLICAGACDLG